MGNELGYSLIRFGGEVIVGEFIFCWFPFRLGAGVGDQLGLQWVFDYSSYRVLANMWVRVSFAQPWLGEPH